MLETNRAALGPLNKARIIQLKEGDQMSVRREDGTEAMTKFKKVEAKIVISKKDAARLSPNEIAARVDKAAIEMARQQRELSHKILEESLESSGQVIDAKGQTLSPQHVFQMIDKVWVSFDDEGKPALPELDGPQRMQEQYAAAWTEIHNSPALTQQLNELIEKKRREWNDREANRRLVD